MRGIFSLSEDLYPVLRSFLGFEDYWYFMNVAKHHFGAIKRKTIYFEINHIVSTRFIENIDHFQERLYSLVENPSQQIALRIINEILFSPRLAELRIHKIFLSNYGAFHLDSLPLLPNIKELHLIEFAEIENITNASHLDRFTITNASHLNDITPLRDVPFVFLDGCHRISDFSIFGKQKRLQIDSCPNLQDVKSFSSIHSLSLHGCPLLSDISPLNNIPILSISKCPLISDLDTLLGYHESLTIADCKYELQGYHILSNIPKVTLRRCNIKDVSVLKDAKSVSLQFCNDLIDITPLATVNEIEIQDCGKIVDLSVIAVIGGDLRPTRIRKSKKRLELDLEDFQLSHIQYLPSNLSHLRIRLHTDGKYFSLNALRYFQNLQWLRIESSQDFSTEGLADIPHVELSSRSLRDVSGLGRNREVHLYFCHEITDVSSLKDVPIVAICDCRKIVDLSCLAKVPRLYI